MIELLAEYLEEIISIFSFFFMIIFVFLSLIERLKERSLKIVGLFLLLIISVNIKNWFVALVAIFIAGTTITNQSFLENIAAIMRRSKEYFDYKKRKLTPAEKEKKIAQDIKSEASEKLYHSKAEKDEMVKYKKIELLAIKKLREEFNENIEQYVRFMNNKYHVELDGVIKSKKEDIIFEIKHTDSWMHIKNILPKFNSLVEKYCAITGKKATLYVIIVSDKLKKNEERTINRLKEHSKSSSQVRYKIFSYKDIGYRGS